MEVRTDTTDELRSWTLERSMPAEQSKVWDAVTDREEMRHWSPFELVGTRSLGAPVTVARRDAGEPEDGHIVTFERPRAFAYAVGGHTRSWEVRADGESGSTLRYVETLDADAPGPANHAEWDARRRDMSDSLDALSEHLTRDHPNDAATRPYLAARGV